MQFEELLSIYLLLAALITATFTYCFGIRGLLEYTFGLYLIILSILATGLLMRGKGARYLLLIMGLIAGTYQLYIFFCSPRIDIYLIIIYVMTFLSALCCIGSLVLGVLKFPIFGSLELAILLVGESVSRFQDESEWIRPSNWKTKIFTDSLQRTKLFSTRRHLGIWSIQLVITLMIFSLLFGTWIHSYSDSYADSKPRGPVIELIVDILYFAVITPSPDLEATKGDAILATKAIIVSKAVALFLLFYVLLLLIQARIGDGVPDHELIRCIGELTAIENDQLRIRGGIQLIGSLTTLIGGRS